MFIFFCCAALVSSAFAGEITIKPCDGNQLGDASDVRLYSPQFEDGTASVILKKGVSYTLEIEWYGTKASTTLTTKVFGEINGIQLPFSGVPSNACLDLAEGKCPLSVDTYYYYLQTLKVESSYPAVPLNIIWILTRADSKNEVCIKLPARITA